MSLQHVDGACGTADAALGQPAHACAVELQMGVIGEHAQVQAQKPVHGPKWGVPPPQTHMPTGPGARVAARPLVALRPVPAAAPIARASAPPPPALSDDEACGESVIVELGAVARDPVDEPAAADDPPSSASASSSSASEPVDLSDALLVMTAYMNYSLQEARAMPVEERAKANRSVNQIAAASTQKQAHGGGLQRRSSQTKAQTLSGADADMDVSVSGYNLYEHSSMGGERDGDGGSGDVTVIPHYHARQFMMAHSYWKLRCEEDAKRGRPPQLGDLQSYLRDHAEDWMPNLSSFLLSCGNWAWLMAFEQFFFIVVLLPINVLFLSDEGEWGRQVRHAYSTYAFSLWNVPLPSSDLIKYTRRRRIALCAFTTLCWMSLVIPIPLRYWALYLPFGGSLTSRIDCFFPPCLAALANVCVAGHAVVALNFSKTRHPAVHAAQAVEESVSKKQQEKEEKKAKKAAKLTPAQVEAAALFKVPNDSDRKKGELQRLLAGLVVTQPGASSFLRVPSDTLRLLCVGMKQNDSSWNSGTSFVFFALALALSLLPNVMSVSRGGKFLGDCNAEEGTSERECPFPMALMHLAVLIRIIMMTLTAYFFSFVLHQSAVYFWNKTLVRENLSILLQRLLGSHDIAQLVIEQERSIAAQKKQIRQAQENARQQADGAAGAQSRTAMSPLAQRTSPRGVVLSCSSPSGTAAAYVPSSATYLPTPSSPSACVTFAPEPTPSSSSSTSSSSSSSSASGDLSRLPTDLSVWWAMYQFMDLFDDREGQQVQVTLAWYASFVLFCSAMVLVAAANSWAGIDQLVVFITCATIALLIGAYVFYILYSGIRINEYPTEMHAAIRRAEMRMVVALAIVQRREDEAKHAHHPRNGDGVDSSDPSIDLSLCSLQVGSSLLHRFASSFEFSVLSSPFTVLMFPLTKTLISTGVLAGFTALSSVIAATVTGALGEVV